MNSGDEPPPPRLRTVHATMGGFREILGIVRMVNIGER